MSTASNTAGHVRVNDSNTNTGWGNYNKGGGSPAAEGQIAYQGNPRLAVGTKVNATTDREGVTYDAGTTENVSDGTRLILLKVNVSDNPDVDPAWGVEVAIGSAEGSHYEYVASGSLANNDAHTFYNAVGGIAGSYLFLAIDPTIAEWREATVGSPSLTAVDFYAVGAQFVDGQAKSENVAMDAIDIGSGLTYTGTAFSFQDAITFDQDTEANRFGWAAAVGSVYFLRGRHIIEATGTDTSTVLFPDGYHSTGLAGITANSSDLTLAGSYTGLGRAYSTTDTRPDLDVTGVLTKLTGSFNNFNVITLNATSELTGLAECAVLVQNSATILGATIRTRSLAGAATMTDPNFLLLTGTRFIQGEAGYAIEITTPGVYSATDLVFEGYTNAIYNNSGGAVTINVSGGSGVTVEDGPGASTIIQNTVNAIITGVPAGAEWRLYVDSGVPGELGTIELDGSESHGGGIIIYSYNYTVDTPAVLQVLHDGFVEFQRYFTLGSTAQEVPVTLQPETNT